MTEERDALIYLPSIDAVWGDQRLDEAAGRIAIAFDRRAASAGARFSVIPGTEEEEYGKGLMTRKCSIARTDGAETVPILDLYVLYYQSALKDRFDRRNLLIKALLVVAAIVMNAPGMIRAVVGRRPKTAAVPEAPAGPEGSSGDRRSDRLRAKTRKETLQIAYALLILALFVAYIGILMVALVETVASLPQLGGSNPTVKYPQLLLVMSAAIGAFFPRIRGWVETAAVCYVVLIYYLIMGDQREVVAGRVSQLLEHLAEKTSPQYDRIHVMGFSFGSIVALDSLFPRGRQPGSRFLHVDTLVTIGCPFDLIRSWLPGYFTDRRALPEVPRRWLNVYAPADVLGSNFRDDPLSNEATESVRLKDGKLAILPSNILYSPTPALEELSYVGVLTLMGLRAHLLYWDEQLEADTAYGEIIPRMYGGNRRELG